MITHVYSIRCLTNLHAGSGEAGYGIVDKLVQRDPTTNLPTVHMSGIKGALRQHLEDAKESAVKEIFGSAVKESSDKIQQGKVRFISADLLAFPVPYEGTEHRQPYDLVTTLKITTAFDEKVRYFAPDWNNWAETQVQGDVWKSNAKAFSVGTRELPVVARNYLNDGISENLWYEEFVPREAVFGTIIQGPEALMSTLRTHLDAKVIQLGANATVGNGYCLFTLQNA
jgi:CRISPR-associated protein Cmr4